MEKFNARSIINLIDNKQEQLKRKISSRYFSNTIDELKKEGFSYLSEKIKYNINARFYNDICTSGNILEYSGIVIAVCDNGIYVSPITEIYDNMDLDFIYDVKFGVNMYNELYSIIGELFKNE